MLEAHLDFETFSELDLKKVGAYRYAEHPSTEILLAAYALGDGPIKLWSPAEGEEMPADLIEILDNPEVEIRAWNANFERCIISNKLANGAQRALPARFRCAMVETMALGLPGKLETACGAIGVPEDKTKAKDGARLIRKFCRPRKPSKNNPVTRWLPAAATEDWAKFRAYCINDVEAERWILNKTKVWRQPDREHKLWVLDQEINDRGVPVDMELVRAAIAMGTEHKQALLQRATEITGLANPNSRDQLLAWLNSEDAELDDLRKKTVANTLKQGMLPDQVREVLELRQEIAKTSLAKYDTLIRATCDDGRIRGTMQFGGANRTMRWAGRLLQVQNLPQGNIENLQVLAAAREVVRFGDYEVAKLMFGDVAALLSTLIRTCLAATPDTQIISADFSAIEALALAWFADCKWRMEVFNTHGKIYEASAARAFKVPFEEFAEHKKRTGRHHPLRKKGKVIELACIAEGQPVLTERGLVPIERVLLTDRVWDGVSFVPHEGVVFRGVKEVSEYDGLRATRDHLVWTEQGTAEFGDAASGGARLLKSGAGGTPIRVGRGNKRREALYEGVVSTLCKNAMSWLRSRAVAQLVQLDQWKVERLSGVLAAADHAGLAIEAHRGDAKALSEFPGFRLQKLWWERNRIPVFLDACRRSLDTGKPGCGERQGLRSDRQLWALCTGKSAICESVREHAQFESDEGNQGRQRVGEKEKPIRILHGLPTTSAGSYPRGNSGSSAAGCLGKEEKLERDTGGLVLTRVYDIVNAGPRHRFTVSDVLVHNCGYGGSDNALITMGALEQGITIPELHPMVVAWREASPEIVDFWWAVDRAAKKCLRTHKRQELKCGIDGNSLLVFRYAAGMLIITLPSGRHMHYFNCRLVPDGNGRSDITYLGIDQTTKQWIDQQSYGPKLVENIVQAFCRDLLCEALLRLWERQYPIIMLVHDEAVFEIKKTHLADGSASLAEILTIMGKPVAFAPRLPLKAAGYVNDFYYKD